MLFPEYGNFNKKIPIELMHPLSVDIIKHVTLPHCVYHL